MFARYDILAAPSKPLNSKSFVAGQNSMRWKLLVIASFAAALIACGLWSGLVIGVFGSARALTGNNWLLFSSTIIPLGISAYSGVFVYRHTARRRKTQAILTVILALLMSAGAYLTVSQIFPQHLGISRNDQMRPSR
jgi:hypothetical protein